MFTEPSLANRIGTAGTIENIAYMIHHYKTALIPRDTEFSKKTNGHRVKHDTILTGHLTESGFGVIPIENIVIFQKYMTNFPYEFQNRRYYLLVNFDKRSNGWLSYFVEKRWKDMFQLDCYAIMSKGFTDSVFVDFGTGTSLDARTVIRGFGFCFGNIHVGDADIAFVNKTFRTRLNNLSFLDFANKVKQKPFKFYPEKGYIDSMTPLEDEVSPRCYISAKTQWIVSRAAKMFFNR